MHPSQISKVLATAGDAIGIISSSQVWVDHVDLSSDLDHDNSYYDGLFDITKGSYGITITLSYLHDHWKASLAGSSDNPELKDIDSALRVTYALNKWSNLNSRVPVFRFGKGHIFNN
jgi:pectate lyase